MLVHHLSKHDVLTTIHAVYVGAFAKMHFPQLSCACIAFSHFADYLYPNMYPFVPILTVAVCLTSCSFTIPKKLYYRRADFHSYGGTCSRYTKTNVTKNGTSTRVGPTLAHALFHCARETAILFRNLTISSKLCPEKQRSV